MEKEVGQTIKLNREGSTGSAEGHSGDNNDTDEQVGDDVILYVDEFLLTSEELELLRDYGSEVGVKLETSRAVPSAQAGAQLNMHDTRTDASDKEWQVEGREHAAQVASRYIAQAGALQLVDPGELAQTEQIQSQASANLRKCAARLRVFNNRSERKLNGPQGDALASQIKDLHEFMDKMGKIARRVVILDQLIQQELGKTKRKQAAP